MFDMLQLVVEIQHHSRGNKLMNLHDKLKHVEHDSPLWNHGNLVIHRRNALHSFYDPFSLRFQSF